MTDKSQKSSSNTFKFVLYQGDDIINERIFSADNFNPLVRYFVDIRGMIPNFIQKFQKALSKRNVSTQEYGYNMLNEYKKIVNLNKVENFSSKLEEPNIVKQNFSGKTIKGVECKFGLYMNDNPIVERNFYVDNYNPETRFSTEIYNLINEMCDDIFYSLKESDVNHMWNDYSLINVYGMFINQIRDLSNIKRNELLNNISDQLYVKKTKSYYRTLQS